MAPIKAAEEQNTRLTVVANDPQCLALRVDGRLSSFAIAGIWAEINKLLKSGRPEEIRLDASGVTYLDNGGVALIVSLRSIQRQEDKRFVLEGMSPENQSLLELFGAAPPSSPKKYARKEWTLLWDVGETSCQIWDDIKSLIYFVGELTVNVASAVRHPKTVRWNDTFQVAEIAGVNALPLVALVSFLVGLILAFQSTIPMRQFDLEIYASNLVALSMLRELGPLMTAIILAGRTGSAFAAEIGTMKVNEEINALKTMGIDPVAFLVLPRVIAASLITPVLTVFANLMGMIGGAIVILSLGYPLITFWYYVESAVTYVDLIGGLVKSFAFGILVAGVGCLRGLQTGSGAKAVGASTTSAVVSAIVLIVLADFIFSLIYFQLGI